MAKRGRDIIQAIDISKEYRRGKRVVQAVKNVNMEVYEGEVLMIMGASGSGKTTLLNLISGLDKPTSGRVILDGIDTSVFDERTLPRFRREKVGFVFQDFNLIENMTASENIETALWPDSRVSGGKMDDRVYAVLKEVDLVVRKDHLPKHLSGGEQQRVAIARAMINNPKILFADEPVANLDTKTGDEILRLLVKISRDKGTTLVMVTHDERNLRFADRIVRIRSGMVSGGGSSARAPATKSESEEEAEKA